MFVRFRWFVLGMASAFGLFSYLATRVKRAKQQITPSNLARRGGRSVAGLLDTTADRIDPRNPIG
jgi:hypothetical protein